MTPEVPVTQLSAISNDAEVGPPAEEPTEDDATEEEDDS